MATTDGVAIQQLKGSLGLPMKTAWTTDLPKLVAALRSGLLLLGLCFAVCCADARAEESEVQIWEFSPYQVHLWYTFEPSIVESEQAKSWLLNCLKQELDRTFRATWNLAVHPAPSGVEFEMQHKLDSLSLASLAAQEYALAVSNAHPDTRVIRTFQAASEMLTSIAATKNTQSVLTGNAVRYGISRESSSGKLLLKISSDQRSDQELMRELVEGKIAAALMPRGLIRESSDLRILPTQFPWQTEAPLNNSDKLFLLSIGMHGDRYTVKAREIDCPVRFLGPMQQATCSSWSDAAQMASFVIRKAFAPVARVESAEATTAQLRPRAGGLMTDDDLTNPSRIQIGDVMQPIIRRDDRSGVPTLLQALEFTFAAITRSDGVKLQANVYTYSGGPGLRGRQNPRTQRVLLRVRPVASRNDLQIVVRGNRAQAQAGCFVYAKDHVTDEFTYLGRTDWRGRLTITADAWPLQILPADIKSQREADQRQARESTLAKARQAHDELVNRAKSEGKDIPEFVPPILQDELPPIDPDALISLSAPLIQLYVKSGETVLARLPLVPGLKEVEVAELPDDRLRLQSEALVRGFQGEILDLIGQRNLLAARVRYHVQRNNLDRAERDMEQLRSLKDFNQMNDQLSQLQRSILEQSNPGVPRSTQAQIDRMFKITRDILQKYLQQDVVAETARLLRDSSQ